MAKSKIPSINFSVSHPEDYEVITSMSETKRKIFDRVVECVKQGLKTKKKSIDIFRIHNTDRVLNLDRGQWKESLCNAIKFYAEMEEYEKCQECQGLINNI